jgi:Ser/Thr protein kinase RdoA (MazF antagonist)
MAQLMERQTKVPPTVLDRSDLLALADSLHSAVDAMEALGVPDALGHLDLNPANIVVTADRCAFLDWAEAYVGNPFLSLEYLLQHARRTFGDNSDVRAKMMEAYCERWHGVVSPAVVTEALIFAPLLAVYAYAAAIGWKEPHELEEPAAGYLRSLTRRIHCEAKQLANRRTLCPQ